MSAGVLREAAALMRERAEGATQGTWFIAPGAPYGGVLSDSGEHLPPSFKQVSRDAYGGWLIAESVVAPNRVHIASWHPTVALAVADWLEATAVIAHWEQFVGIGPVATSVAKAVAVARAYLGRDT